MRRPTSSMNTSPCWRPQGEMPGHRFLGDQAEALDGAQQRRQLGPAQGGTAQAEVAGGTGPAGMERHVDVPGACGHCRPVGATPRSRRGPAVPRGQQPGDLGPIPGGDLRGRLFGIAGWQALEEPTTGLPLRGQLLTVTGGPVLDEKDAWTSNEAGPFLRRCPHRASMSLPMAPTGPSLPTGGAAGPPPLNAEPGRRGPSAGAGAAEAARPARPTGRTAWRPWRSWRTSATAPKDMSKSFPITRTARSRPSPFSAACSQNMAYPARAVAFVNPLSPPRTTARAPWPRASRILLATLRGLGRAPRALLERLERLDLDGGTAGDEVGRAGALALCDRADLVAFSRQDLRHGQLFVAGPPLRLVKAARRSHGGGRAVPTCASRITGRRPASCPGAPGRSPIGKQRHRSGAGRR